MRKLGRWLLWTIFAIFALLMLGIVGPLIPDETILVLSGIAVHRGQLELKSTILAAFGGSLCGITLSYLLGRTGAIAASLLST